MERTIRLAWWVSVAALLPLTFGCGTIDLIKARQLARDGNKAYLESDYRGAIGKYEEARKLDPECPNLYLNLGYSYFSVYDPDSQDEFEKGAADRAVESFEEHLRRNPKDENARIFLIKTLLKAAPSNPALADRANKTFLEMLVRNPNDYEARQYLTTLFIDAKRYDDAVTFFGKDLEKKPDDVETMKILAIIADKSERIQDAVDWYFKRGEVTSAPDKQAVMFYEVGTYAWNLIHYQPNRATGVDAIKLLDQGIEATKRAIKLKDKYAEAMVYANLCYLKRAMFETDDVAKTWDQQMAFDFRSEASKILIERKKTEEEQKAPGSPAPAGGAGDAVPAGQPAAPTGQQTAPEQPGTPSDAPTDAAKPG